MSANGLEQNAPPQPYISWVDPSGTTQWFTFDLVKNETWTDDAVVTEHPVEQGANIADHVTVALEKCELVIRATNEPLDANAFTNAQSTQQTLPITTPKWVPGNGLITVTQWNNQIELRALAGTLVGLGGGVSGTAGQVGGLVANALAGVLLAGYQSSSAVQTSAGLQPPLPVVALGATVQNYASAADFVEQTHAKLKQLKDSAQLLSVFGTKQVGLQMAIESLSFVRNGDTGTGEMVTVGFKEVRLVSTKVVAVPIPHLSAGGGNPPANHGAQNPADAPNGKQVAQSLLLNGGNLLGGSSLPSFLQTGAH